MSVGKLQPYGCSHQGQILGPERPLDARRVEWNYTRSRLYCFTVPRLDKVNRLIVCLPTLLHDSLSTLGVLQHVAQDWTAASVTDLPQSSHAG
jgi:hypothetical protein